jgi:hypothetical protein
MDNIKAYKEHAAHVHENLMECTCGPSAKNPFIIFKKESKVEYTIP